MATLNVIYKIAADISGLQNGVDRAATSTEKLASMAGTVGKALTAAFTVAAVEQIASRFIDVASRLTDLSQKTGISTTGLQKLDLAFSQAGVTLDTVTGSIAKLSKNLIGGDKTAVGAMEKLGLSINELKALSPDEMFVKVADKIGGIANPTEKAYAAMAIFGRGGVELLAGLDGKLAETTKGFEDMGLIIDEKTIKAADDFGDQLGLMGRQLLGIVATVVGPLLPALSALGSVLMWIGANVIGPVLNASIKVVITLLAMFWEGLSALLGKLADLSTKIPIVGKHLGFMASAAESLNKSSAKTTEYLKHLWDNTDKVGTSAVKTAPNLLGLGRDTDSAGAAAKKAAEELARLTEKVHALEAGLFGVPDALHAIGKSFDESKLGPMADAIAKVEQNAHIANFGFKGMTDSLKDVGMAGEDTAAEMEKLDYFVGPKLQTELRKSTPLIDSLDRILSNIGGRFVEVAAVGLRAASEISKVAQAAHNAGDALSKGDWLKIAAIGVSALVTAFGKLFGNNAEKQINPIREAFVQLHGGLAALNAEAANAGVTLRAMLDAKNPEQYKKAIDDLNAAFDFQKSAMDTLQSTLAKYNFTIEEMGPALQRQEMGKQAEAIYQDWMVLNAAGIDTVVIAGRMADSVNEFIKRSISMGLEVPIAMKPMLQTMIDQGLLTDAAGNKITDLADSGITFAETMSQGFQKVVEAVKSLTDAISRGLGTAINNIPTERTIHIGYSVDAAPGFGPEYAAHGGLVTRHGIQPQYFGSGGNVLPFTPKGSDTVAAMLTPGELVLTPEQASAYRRGSGGGGRDNSAAVVNELRSLRSELAEQRRSLPRAIRDALLLAS